MIDLHDLHDLIDRLEDTRGPDREIDAALDAALRIGSQQLPTWARTRFPEWRAVKPGAVELVHADGTGGSRWDSQAFTRSIEAATYLCERMLPEWGRMSYWNNCQGHVAGVEDNANAESTGRQYEATGPNAAIALCCAVLKALADRPELLAGGA